MRTKANHIVPTLYFLMECMLDNLATMTKPTDTVDKNNPFEIQSATFRAKYLDIAIYTVTRELDAWYGNKDDEIANRWVAISDNWNTLVNVNLPVRYLPQSSVLLEQMRTEGEIALTISYLLYGERAYSNVD